MHNGLSCLLCLSPDFDEFLGEFVFCISFFHLSNYHCLASRIITVHELAQINELVKGLYLLSDHNSNHVFEGGRYFGSPGTM